MGKSQTPRAGRLLLFSPLRGKTPLVLPCEGRDAGTGVRPTSGNRVSTLQGAVHLISGNWVSPSQGAAGRPLGKDRVGLACRGPQVVLWEKTEKVLRTLSCRRASAEAAQSGRACFQTRSTREVFCRGGLQGSLRKRDGSSRSSGVPV